MVILAIGDVVGKIGCTFLREKLPKLKRIVFPQEAVLEAESLPDESVVLVLTGGDAS